jgi:hypothetical protein
MSDSQGSSLLEIRRAAADIQVFAMEEMRRSRLPGGQFGPADAYRHMIGVAELTRRFGALPAYAAAEYNEFRSLAHGVNRTLHGEEEAASQTPAARAMDRHNNGIGLRIGARAATPEEVVAAARAEIERAYKPRPAGQILPPGWSRATGLKAPHPNSGTGRRGSGTPSRMPLT